MTSPLDPSGAFEQAGLGGIFDEMARLQRRLADAQAVAGATEIVGSSGGGAVRIHASGEFSFDGVEIDPAAVSSNDVSMLEDLVLATLRDAATQLIEVQRHAMGQAVGGASAALLKGSDEGDVGETAATDRAADDGHDPDES